MTASVRSVGAQRLVTVSTATTARPDLPAGWQVNDILLLAIAQTGGFVTDIRSLDTYSQIVARDNGSNVGLILAWQRARADSVSPTISIDNQVTDPTILNILAIRDALISGSPFANTPTVRTTSVNSTTATADSATPSEDDTLHLFFAAANANATARDWSGTNPAFTEDFESATATNTGALLACASGQQAVAAATGARTVTLSLSTTSAVSILTVKSQPVVVSGGRMLPMVI